MELKTPGEVTFTKYCRSIRDEFEIHEKIKSTRFGERVLRFSCQHFNGTSFPLCESPRVSGYRSTFDV